MDRQPRNIVLFSDGTGNSSKKLLKTNVWRMYEALDLRDPAVDDGMDQVAYYDDGVGTSALRPLALLGGVFGFGLARNIRELYKFLCRHWQPGDRIYAIGFSRGSYTIRLLVGFIALMGVPAFRNESELDLHARDLWREFRRGFHTNNPFSDFLVCLLRWLFRGTIRAKRRLFGQVAYGSGLPEGYERKHWFTEWCGHWRGWFRHRVLGMADNSGRFTAKPYTVEDWQTGQWFGPEIEFVGVFDTVAAYGGPIVEITRAIDDWFWPLSMPDYRLSPRVRCARHALAIDDKRGSFEPLLWDEMFELARPGYDPANPRMKQVWFAGMHADVGGGYSDEALSYVPLDWMMREAEAHGLTFLRQWRERISHYANVHGLMHDSRAGLGSFYRYQPRYISAWVHDQRGRYGAEIGVSPLSAVFRDQMIDRGRYRTQGLLEQPIRLHADTERRMLPHGCGYAPINLSGNYRVEGRADGDEEPAYRNPTWYEGAGALGTRIRIRRGWYFLSMFAVALLATHGWWQDSTIWQAIKGWLRVDGVVPQAKYFPDEWLAFALPDLAVEWAQRLYFDWPAAVLLFAILLFAMMKGSAQENTMRDIAEAHWRYRFVGDAGAKPALPALNPVRRSLHGLAYLMRKSEWLQRLMARLKWRAIPTLVGLGLWYLVILLAIAGWHKAVEIAGAVF